MTIRFQFVLGADWSSRLIAWYGQGYGGYSHVDALLPDGSLLGARSDEIGGQPAGVRLRPPNYAKWKARTILELPATVLQAQQWEAYLRTQVGCPYDRADILGFVLGKPIMSEGHWICSALQLNSLEVIGRIPHLGVTPQQCPPNMLAVILSTAGAVLGGGTTWH